MEVLATLFAVIFFLLLIALYFLPSVIAVIRNHRNRIPIILVNILLGWSFVGWVVSLVWAFTDNCEKP